MSYTFFCKVMAAGLISTILPAVCQEGSHNTSAPLYRVTVVERSVDAVNYQYHAGPTNMDFRGTVLLAKGKGEATVESRRGRTEIDARFSNLAAPTRFGREYLAYVLWAISPEGAPHNLGEIIPDASDHGHLHVTTDLQVFGLIVTGEPYSSVREPSDVVVLENQVRPDTVGRVQPIQAKYELMPRGHYTWNVQESLENAVTGTPKVSMPQYEALLELYQAQNAIGVARAANAEQYAPDILAKAQQAFERAQRLQSTKTNASLVVQNAREAAQTAEDARTITERRKNSDQVAQAQAETVQAQQAKAGAEAAAQMARADADAARAQTEAERAARERAEAEAIAARLEEQQAQADRIQPTVAPSPEPARSPQSSQTQLRAQLLERVNEVLAVRDTPRGLVVTVTESDFGRTALRPAATHEMMRLASILVSQPELQVAVEGYTDSTSGEAIWSRRAVEVRNALIAAGLPANQIYSQDFGNSRPLASNATAAGRQENRRVEIVISGAPIGSLPIWDRTYEVAPR
jgi:outer membrane protein OmpA-like peptidoglycan-associated protein